MATSASALCLNTTVNYNTIDGRKALRENPPGTSTSDWVSPTTSTSRASVDGKFNTIRIGTQAAGC
jgi:hypothetical protein